MKGSVVVRSLLILCVLLCNHEVDAVAVKLYFVEELCLFFTVKAYVKKRECIKCPFSTSSYLLAKRISML